MSTLSMKRSVDFKDPSKTKKPNTQLWNSITQMPKHKLEEYIRPKILIRDKQACEDIIEKIKNEQVATAMQKQWFIEERQSTKARLMRQKQKNIELEEKAGIKKNYQPVGVSLAENSLNAAISQRGQRASVTASMNTSPVLSQDQLQGARYEEESPSTIPEKSRSKLGTIMRESCGTDGLPMETIRSMEKALAGGGPAAHVQLKAEY